MRILGILLLSCICAAAAYAQTPTPAGTSGSTPAPTTGTAEPNPTPKADAVSGTLILKTSLTSKNATEGKEVKAALKQAVVLPGGETLPKGTMVYGRVALVSPHSKAKPNGALLLVFDEARPKGAPVVLVLVKIQQLAPESTGDDDVALPGARLGGTSNSGAMSASGYQLNDRTSLKSNIKLSGITNVYLQNSAGGSGAVFSSGEDVALDSDIQMTVLIAKALPKSD